MLIGAPGLDCVFPGSTDAYPEGQDLSGSNGMFYRGACGTVIATQIAISPPTSCSDREMNGDETGVDCGGSCGDPAICDVSALASTLSCRSSGDPHFKAFGGEYYDFYGLGEYVLFAATSDRLFGSYDSSAMSRPCPASCVDGACQYTHRVHAFHERLGRASANTKVAIWAETLNGTLIVDGTSRSVFLDGERFEEASTPPSSLGVHWEIDRTQANVV